MTTEDASDLVPSSGGLPKLRTAAASCRACDLWKTGTQTVFGEGTRSAEIMLVGEQPGDREDIEGAPFVGPAGRLLDRALEEADIERRAVYLTNVVKHFKWEPKGKRRIHKKPNLSEIAACRPWFEAELRAVAPLAVVCLGATAAQAVIGRDFRVTKQRGELVESPVAEIVTATVHPSSVLRAPDEEARRQAYDEFVTDLARIGSEVASRDTA
jgi:uracil-DNA glycosylase